MKALIIIPTYNELENLPIIIGKVFQAEPTVDILIVDDNSPDGTGSLADEFALKNKQVFVLHRAGKLGLGTAYLAGFKFAIEKNYDVAFEMDADMSHNPKEIPNFLRELEHFDIVLGSRYISGVNVVNWPLGRLLLSYGANLYTRIITGMPIKDATGGYKAIKRKVLESINLDTITSNGYSFQIEVTYKAFCKGFKIKEIPIIFVDRTLGQSKMSISIMKEAVFMVWKLKIQRLFRLI